MRHELILFDLDGTLTDSEPGIVNSVRHALRAFGMDASPETLRLFVGPPLEDSFRNLTGLDEADAKKAVRLYRDYFAEKGIWENALYPGISDMLFRLKRAGRKLVLATSKPEIFARRIVAYFDVDLCFDAVCGADLEGTRSAKSDVIRYALESCGAAPGTPGAVMVGDRRYDVVGARDNGLDFVGALYGYGTLEELREAGAVRFAASVEELGRTLLETD